MKPLLSRLFGARHAQGGIIPKDKLKGPPLKLTGAEGYVRVGGKLYYWKEVEDQP